MLNPGSLDLEDVATALADQADYEHQWLIDPRTGAVVFWTEDTGIDGQNPVDLETLDLIGIDPLPPHVWYQDMADFAELVGDEQVGRRLARGDPGQGCLPPIQGRVIRELPEAAAGVARLP
jgi:hypothetical protein